MKSRVSLLTSFLSSMLLVACGGATEEAAPSVTEWLGAETHLAVSGTFQDLNFDVLLEGDAASSVYCNRFYAPLPGATPDGEGNYATTDVYFAMKELGGVIEVGGEPKEFTISYWRHDLSADSELNVIPREFGSTIPEGQTWSDINMFDPGTNLLSGVESAAVSGTVQLMLNTGSPDENGVVVPTGGRTGEFVSVSWGPRENLNVSATSDCVTVIAPWAQDLVSP